MTWQCLLAWLNTRASLLSAGTAIVALIISTTTALSAARESRKRAEREARAVAYAVLPSVADILLACGQLRIGLETIRRDQPHLFGQTVAASIANLNLTMPPMVDRYLDRLGVLPEEAARECLVFVNTMIAFSRGAQIAANEVGIAGPMEWLSILELRRASLNQVESQAGKTVNALQKVIDPHNCIRFWFRATKS